MDKFISLIQVSNMYALFKDNDKYFLNKIICLALNEEGSIIPIDFDQDGYFDDCSKASNFIKLIYSDLLLKVGVTDDEKELLR